MECYFSAFLETYRFAAMDFVVKTQMQESFPGYDCFNCVPVT